MQCRAEHPKQMVHLSKSKAKELLEGMHGGAWPVAPRGFPGTCSCWGERERRRRCAVRRGKEASVRPDRVVGESGAIPFRLWGGRRQLLLSSLLQVGEISGARLAFRVERGLRAPVHVVLFGRGERRLPPPLFVYIRPSVGQGRRGGVVLVPFCLSLALALSVRGSRGSKRFLVGRGVPLVSLLLVLGFSPLLRASTVDLLCMLILVIDIAG